MKTKAQPFEIPRELVDELDVVLYLMLKCGYLAELKKAPVKGEDVQRIEDVMILDGALVALNDWFESEGESRDATQ